jgi:hypothetical protein
VKYLFDTSMIDEPIEIADLDWDTALDPPLDAAAPPCMPIPSPDIYWDLVLPCLLLKDAAVFEASVDNHRMRQILGLTSPSTTSIAATNPLMNRKASVGSMNLAVDKGQTNLATSSIPVTKYSKYWTGAGMVDVTFVVTSEDKLSWLLKRGIFPSDVSLEFIPLMREDKAFIHFMGNIKVLQMKASCSTVGWIFHLLKSLEKFVAHENKSVDDSFINGFVNQCHINASRTSSGVDGFGPHSLHSMFFNMEKLSVKSVEHLVTNLSDVKAIRLVDGNSTTFRQHLNLVALNLSNLTSIELWNTNIYDSGLEPFKKVQIPLERIKLFRCPHISATGLKDLVATNLGVQELTLELMNITQHALVSVLPSFPSLRKVTLWNNYNRYSDVLIKGFSKCCPSIKRLRLHQDTKGDTYTEDGITALIMGCLEIEELEFSCDNISYTSLHMLLVRYKYTMKKFWVPGKLKAKIDVDEGFINANWNVRCNDDI